MRRTAACLVLILLIPAGACAQSDVSLGSGGSGASTSPITENKPPAEDPYLIGTVVSATKRVVEPVTENCVEPDPDPNGTATDRDPPVCSASGATFRSLHIKGGGNEVVAGLDPQVPVVRKRDGGYEPVAFDGIAKGDRVRLWITGMVRQSDPAQVDARFVVVEE